MAKLVIAFEGLGGYKGPHNLQFSPDLLTFDGLSRSIARPTLIDARTSIRTAMTFRSFQATALIAQTRTLN
jgi:hypothetical protein